MSDKDLTVKFLKDPMPFLRAIQVLPKDLAKATQEALEFVAMFYQDQVKKAFDDGGPPGFPFLPNAPQTIERKGSSAPLIDNADMRNSVTYKILDGRAFVGLLRQTQHPEYPDGMANLGEIHEFGTRNGRIPPRPFMEPIATSRNLMERSSSIYQNAVRKKLDKKGWGR